MAPRLNQDLSEHDDFVSLFGDMKSDDDMEPSDDSEGLVEIDSVFGDLAFG